VKIIVLADIHGQLEPLVRMQKPLSEADIVLLAGDITNFGGTQQTRAVLDTLGRFAKRILAVPGNCDPQTVDAYLTHASVKLHGRAVCGDGGGGVGAGGALPELGQLPNVAGEKMFTDALDRGLAQCQNPQRLILVTHQPAWNTALDTVAPGRHAGNRAIRYFIDRTRPSLAISGHLHDIIGTDCLGPTTLLNPGPAKNSHYALINLTDNDLRVQLY
jgi:Icc-related predicted phosphoesterase